jgi:hypothetical protein
MTDQQAKFFLILSTIDADLSVNKLSAAGILYVRKLLDSGPAN